MPAKLYGWRVQIPLNVVGLGVSATLYLRHLATSFPLYDWGMRLMSHGYHFGHPWIDLAPVTTTVVLTCFCRWCRRRRGEGDK